MCPDGAPPPTDTRDLTPSSQTLVFKWWDDSDDIKHADDIAFFKAFEVSLRCAIKSEM